MGDRMEKSSYCFQSLIRSDRRRMMMTMATALWLCKTYTLPALPT